MIYVYKNAIKLYLIFRASQTIKYKIQSIQSANFNFTYNSSFFCSFALYFHYFIFKDSNDSDG